MNVLAFDTCFGAVSAAVLWRDAIGKWQLRDAFELLAVGHAERLLPMLDAVMADAGLGFDQLERIAVTIGPGGFTGLRVGVSAARALALATGLPVAGLSSLTVMAARTHVLLGAASALRPLVVAVDARRGAFYVQMFEGGAVTPLSVATLLDAEDAVACLPNGPVLIVGSGAVAIARVANRANVECALPDLAPHARQLAEMAQRSAVLDRVTPLYLRSADAKPSSAPPLSRRSGP